MTISTRSARTAGCSRRREGAGLFALGLVLGAMQLAAGGALAQDRVRSLVVSSEAAARILPPKPGTAPGVPIGSQRYWADTATNSIRRSNLDGSGVEVVVNGLQSPYGLSYDASAGVLLWTSSVEETVQKLPLAGGSPAAIETQFEEPFAIVVSGEGQETGYAVLGGEVVRIVRYSMAETEEKTVLMTFDPAAREIHGLALDGATGALYIGNAQGQMTQKVRLADGTVETLQFVEESFPLEPMPIEEVP
jgi:hypothetical protein